MSRKRMPRKQAPRKRMPRGRTQAQRAAIAMRLERSIRNLLAGWLGQAVFVVVNFVTLSVFNHELGQRYMDVQGLFTNVLVILSLSELGVGMAITYELYRPLADNDIPRIRSLMRLFKRAYLIIGVAIIGIGGALTPFIQHLINGTMSIPTHELQLYFFCFVLNSGISYFFSYKGALIIADQKKYFVLLYQYGFQIGMCVAQIIVLLLTRNYLLFLCCLLASTLLQNILTARKADRLYPYIKEKTAIEPIEPTTLQGIKKNIFALVLHRIATIASTPVSTLIVNSAVGTATVGMYYVYNSQIITGLFRIMDQAFDAIIASVGNLAVTESKERQTQVFKTTFFINALLYTITAVPLLCVIDVFVGDIWLDQSYVFPFSITALIVALYFLKGMRSAGLSFIQAYGLYWQTRWKAIIESVVLVSLCLILVVEYQIAGVVVAGLISTLLVSSVYEGVMLFKHGLKQSCRWYFLRLALYALVAFALSAVAYAVCALIPGEGIGVFFAKGFVALVIAAGGFTLVFFRTNEFHEFMDIIRRLFVRLRSGISRRSSD
jgi:O-antigen/teichoic acid export membrane protein